jgi:hypothetical protein
MESFVAVSSWFASVKGQIVSWAETKAGEWLQATEVSNEQQDAPSIQRI